MKAPHRTYAEWSKTYGDIVYSRVFGQDFLIVNSEKTARLLADKRSTIYSDRPHSSIYELFGVDHTTPVMSYNNQWKLHRKLFQPSLRPEAVANYRDLYISSAHRLLHELQHKGPDLGKHFNLFSGALALELTYGRKITGEDDPTIKLANNILSVLGEGLTPENGGLLLAFPILAYFPSWFPGLGFKTKAVHCKKMMDKMSDLLFGEAKKQMASGTLQRCLVSEFLAHDDVEESVAKGAASGVYLAAAENTASTLETLVLALLLNPDVQERVHAELDAIVGKGIFPTFEDQPRLPYLQAVLYETMRWNPILPIGTMVVFNVWAMARDCPNPERFDPSRHLSPDGQLSSQAKQNNALFFGVCPGRFFVDNTLWAAAAVLLSALRFEKAKDAFGNIIDVEPVFTHGQIRLVIYLLEDLR
ncbi:hypothetical protein ID866_5143 [Astraeus odoratus]|nr:hypothetical protein ID866_5143 [Astraeus odoratus]